MEMQSQHKAAVEKFERQALGIGDADTESDKTEPQWEDMEASVQDTMSRDEKGDEEEALLKETTFAVQDSPKGDKAHSPAIEEGDVDSSTQSADKESTAIALEPEPESGPKPGPILPSDLEANETFETGADGPFLDTIKDEKGPIGQVLAMTLTIRNKINDKYEARPNNLSAADTWKVEYSLVERDDPEKAWALYEACKARRAKRLTAQPDEGEENISGYIKSLRRLSEKGRKWRESMDAMDEAKPVRVLGKS